MHQKANSLRAVSVVGGNPVLLTISSHRLGPNRCYNGEGQTLAEKDVHGKPALRGGGVDGNQRRGAPIV